VLLLLLPAVLLGSSLVDDFQNFRNNHFSDIPSDPADNDAWKSMEEICDENGFAFEEYRVVT
jgi:hypothetical protein